jgi:hypothetical protein
MATGGGQRGGCSSFLEPSIFFLKEKNNLLIFYINNQMCLCLFCKLKSDKFGLGGNSLLVAKTPLFLPGPNSSTSL